MKIDSSDQQNSLVNKLKALENGFDPERADALLDELFRLARETGTSLSLVADPRMLRVQSPDALVCEQPVRLAPAKLRSLCARLAVRCQEWTGRDISLHGADVEIEYPGMHTRFHIHMENTEGQPRIDLEPISVSEGEQVGGNGVRLWGDEKAKKDT